MPSILHAKIKLTFGYFDEEEEEGGGLKMSRMMVVHRY